MSGFVMLVNVKVKLVPASVMEPNVARRVVKFYTSQFDPELLNSQETPLVFSSEGKVKRTKDPLISSLMVTNHKV